MRHRILVAIAALLVTSSSVARAQSTIRSTAAPASIDVGLRFTDITGDQARFQRFRDIGDGALVERFRFDREGNGWFWKSGADHVGRQDQRYWGEYGGVGKVKVRFQWDQIPLFISQDTRTLYSVRSPGVLRIGDDIRQGIQNGQLQLADVTGRASAFDVRSRRDIAQFNVVYSPTRDVDVKVNFRTTHRDGTMPWGATFGFSNDVELPAPIDTRTTDLNAGVEWADARGSLRIGYDGSWFDNKIQTLVWDNPWKFTDTPAGSLPSQGRLALWPSSSMQGVSSAGSLKLPGNSRLAANVSVGQWNQNEPLLPFTVNTTIPVAPLERATAQAAARTLAMNYNFTSRPSRFVWVNTRYRYYDFDNRTPPFDATGRVRLDQITSSGHITEPLSSKRHTVDLDASFTPIPFTAVRVGYGREMVDRAFRIFERTTDDVFRASIDTTGAGWITVRGIFERSSRVGSRFDEELLDEIGEQPAMRHFDIADRNRDRVTALVQMTPVPAVGFSMSVAAGKDNYRNSGFGLRDNENEAYTMTADLVPRDEIAAGVTYTYERYRALQRSRNANPGVQFDDPSRNWSIDSADKVHTVSANVDLLKLLSKTDVKFAYNISRSTVAYVYGQAPGSTLSALQQLPPVTNELQTGTVDARYSLTEKLAIGVIYWYDRYRVNDFALGPDTISRLDLPGSLFLGYVYRPYTASSASLRFIYIW